MEINQELINTLWIDYEKELNYIVNKALQNKKDSILNIINTIKIEYPPLATDKIKKLLDFCVDKFKQNIKSKIINC